MRWRRNSRLSRVPFRRGGYIAWGYRNGQFTPAQLAIWARVRYGAGGGLALELDDFDNRDFWAEHVAACIGHDVVPGCWFTEGYNIVTTPANAQFSIAELEGRFGGPGDWEGINNAITWDQLPDCRLAIVTNFSDAQTGEADALIEADFHCQTEAYLGDNPNATPSNLDHKARSLGWDASQPVFGLWNAPEALYTPYAQWQGWDYLVENVFR